MEVYIGWQEILMWEGENVGQTQLSPTQIRTIENIGQWEFLSISDEELIDTTRHGFFGDDKLVRIYYGTLRLGIDMKEVKEALDKNRERYDCLYTTSNQIT